MRSIWAGFSKTKNVGQKKRNFFAGSFSILAALLITGGLFAAHSLVSAQDLNTLSGLVEDQNNNPIPHALVTVSAGGTSLNTYSNADGSYSISSPPAIYTDVTVNVSGGNGGYYSTGNDFFTVHSAANLDLTSGNLSQNFKIAIAPVTVKVRDASGNPVSGVSVEGLTTSGQTPPFVEGSSLNGAVGPGNVQFTQSTDSNGNTTINLPVGSNYFSGGGIAENGNICAFLSFGKVCLASPTTIASSTTEIDINAPQTYTVSGKVKDQNANSIPGARVTYQSSNYQVTGSADSSGNYSMAVPAATYSKVLIGVSGGVNNYYPSSNDFFTVSSSTNLTVSSNESQDFTLTLVPVTMSTYDSGGNPVASVPIEGLSTSGGFPTFIDGTSDSAQTGPGNTQFTENTNSSGTLTLNLPQGASFSAGGTTNEANNICAHYSDGNICLPSSYTVSGPATLNFNQLAKHTLSGNVKDQQGSPIPNARITITSDDGKSASVLADNSGHYSLLAAGAVYTKFSVQVQGVTSSYYPSSSDFFTLTSNSNIDLTNADAQRNVTLTMDTITLITKDNSGNPAGNVSVEGLSISGSMPGIISDSNSAFAGPGNIQFVIPTSVNGITTIRVPQGTQYNQGGTTFEAGNICALFQQGKSCISAPTVLNADTTIVFQQGGLVTMGPTVQAVNAGGSASGSYSADTGFYGGSTYSSTAPVGTGLVTDPAPQDVYQTVRYGNDFSYTFSGLTPGSTHTVVMHFNEPYFGVGNNGGGVGSRVFNVGVNGQSALSNYDIYKTAGGANQAVTEQAVTTADSNGRVTVHFSAVTDNAIVSGLQLFQGALPAPAPHPTHVFGTVINAGGSATGSFVADTDFSGGTTYSTSDAVDTSGVTNPAPQSVFQTARYGTDFSYTIPDLAPNTTYNLRLDFNELYFGAGGNSGGTGSRVFNVAINGDSKLSNFDIYAEAGGANKAVAKDFTVTSDADGKITIQFTGVTDNAIVSGVEVTKP